MPAHGNIGVEQLEAMGRNWESRNKEELRNRIVELRGLYDWPALVAAINACPGQTSGTYSGSHASSAGDGFQLIDLFNLLDMHLQSGHGFRGEDGTFLPHQRVLGARGALGLLIQSMFYVDWHVRARSSADLKHHYDFGLELGRRMQIRGQKLADGARPETFEEPEFILGDVTVLSMNWDPIGLWAQILANRRLNRAPTVPHVGAPARRMQLNHDLGYFIAGPRVEKDHLGSKVWQPMNISGARQLNDPDHGAHVRIRVSQFLFPHGCLWWRECPSCGKLSSYLGDTWETNSKTLLPPPPLKAFATGVAFESWCRDSKDEERPAWTRGEVDARACVHCETLTYAHHAPLVMQTSFKTSRPPFLEEIQREMRVVVEEADHIVFMGYGLPPDDVTYRAFLAARTRRDSPRQVKCSVIGKDKHFLSGWHYPDDLSRRSRLPDAVCHAQELFGAENVRYYGAGIPEVFRDGAGEVTAATVDRLLCWNRR